MAVQIDKVRERLQKQREELGKLQARQANMQEHAKAEGALQKVLEQRERKPGIFGTIAELGKVDAKYALAMEIAAGPRLKTIVVEDEKVAADMIKFLKAGRYGHATFLPLSKIREPEPGEAKKLAKSKGVVGLALDLIDFDPRFKKAFEYVYANTIVIDDIDVARRLGIGKAKMVTLDGDIVETSGLMTGGFRKARPSMGFSQKELDSSMESIGEEMEELGQSLSALENRRKEVEENITKLRQEKAELEGEIIRTEKSLHLGPTDLEQTLSKKEALQGEITKLDKEIEKLGNTVAEKNRLLAQNRIEKQSLRAKTAQLRDPKLLAELATFEEKRNQMLQDLATAENEIKNKELQVHDIHVPESEKISKILKQISKEEDDFRTEIEYLEKEKKEKEEQLKKKEAAAKDFQAKWRALFEKRNRLGDEINALELQASRKADESRKFEIQENTLTLQHAEIAGELAGLQQEFSQYEGVQLFESKSEEQLRSDIAKFEKLKADIGSVNMRALEVYDQVEKEYTSLLGKKDTLFREKEDVIGLMNEIEGKKKELFMNQFNIVNRNFKHIFTSLSTKGEARLELEVPQSPFEGGVDVQVNIEAGKISAEVFRQSPVYHHLPQ
ncbi:hypothetical protein HYU14_07700 [Candidatus Woesearchaeota archaeon]|nr:hypothetical protein [Candidatus Woesearchaeota archaeon]